MLQFQTFGTIDLRRGDGERLERLPGQPKRLALLTVLSTRQPVGPVHREKLVSLLWPDSAPSSGRAALSTTLSRLRDVLGEEVVRGRGEESIGLSAEHFRSDVAAFQRALEAKRYRAAVEHYEGPFLEGLRPPDAKPFVEWMARRRDEYGQQAYRAAMGAAGKARSEGDLGLAEASLRKAQEIEPLREEAVRVLIELRAERGDAASAVQLYQRFRERLQKGVGLSPSEELEGLVQSLRSGPGSGGGSGPTAASRTDDGSVAIAVLPFEELGREQSSTVGEGMHDALLTRLSNISGLSVISRTSVQRYRDTVKTTTKIADELGVSWVLEGGVQKIGDQIQVNVQLIDPRSDTHAWAKSYRRDFTAEDLFALQTEITKRIARSLATRLTSREKERVERRPTEDLSAYRLYIQGKAQIVQRTETGLRSGLRAFERAIEKDPTYARAWSGVADARTLLWDYGFSDSDRPLEEARREAERALELDANLAEGHASLALVEAFRTRDGPEVLGMLGQAVRLKPSYAQAHLWTGYIQAALGRLGPSVRHLERAAELDPTAAVVQAALAHGHLLMDHLPEAVRHAVHARKLSPECGAAYLFEGQILTIQGRSDEAVTAIERGQEFARARVRRRHLRYLAWLTVALTRAGEVERAREVSRRIERSHDRFADGVARLALGDEDAAFEAFRRTEWTPMHAMNIRSHPVLTSLQRDSRYRALIRDVNRSWGLNPDGSLPDNEDVTLDSWPDD